MDMMRQQFRMQKEKALAEREQTLAMLSQFRSEISKLVREDVPALVKMYRTGNRAAANTEVGRGQRSNETLYSSIQSLKTRFDGQTTGSAKSPAESPKGKSSSP